MLHLDLTPTVRAGRSDLAFSLAVLGGLVDPVGKVFITPKNVNVFIELTVPQEVLRKVKEKLSVSIYILALLCSNSEAFRTVVVMFHRKLCEPKMFEQVS